jgi:hypothetical protein
MSWVRICRTTSSWGSFMRGESQIKRALTVLKLGKRFPDNQPMA